MNKTLRIIYPLLLAIAVAGGVVLGIKLQSRIQPTTSQSVNLFQNDKLSLLLKLIERDYVDSVNSSEIVENAIPLILEDLDPHTTYIPAKEMQAVSEEMRGNFSGIGVQFVMQKDTVMVVDVVSGGPSQKLGILAGDRIVKVNGDTIAGIGLQSDSIVSLLRGKKGTHVIVDIQRRGIEPLIEFDIERGEIPLFSVDVSYIIEEGIGFIKVNRFAENTYSEFIAAIQDLKEKSAEKLIIDLRGNTGGYLQAVFNMVDEFLNEQSMIVYTFGKARPRYDYRSTSKGIWKNKDVAVLIDEFSASASEIFAGAIQDNDRGIIVGRRSFGKGLVQEQIPFMDGSAIRLTIARFYTPSGRCIQKSYDNGNDEYRMDIHHRITQHEFTQKDSIHLVDSLRYYTVGGRPVYGGGGIMPDFFVPADTSAFNDFFSKVLSQNLIYHFAFNYADVNREKLNEYNTVDELEKHLKDEEVFSDFIDHLKQKSIQPTKKELADAGQLMQAQLYAYVGRNILGDDGFYPIIFKIDNTVQKAVNLLQTNWSAQKVAAIH